MFESTNPWMVLPDETLKKVIQGTERPKGVIKSPRDLKDLFLPICNK